MTVEISPSTLGAFEAAERERFIEEIARLLEDEMPNEARGLGAAGTRALVNRMVQRADAWRIEDSEAIGQLCGLALGFGEAVFDQPEVTDYLSAHEGDRPERVAALIKQIEALPDD